MPRNQNSQNPLSYLGVQAPFPPNLTIHKRSPTANNNTGFRLGDIWLVRTIGAQEIWMLVGLAGGVATWVELFPGGGGGANSFPTNAGVANEAGGVLNVLGTSVIETTGAGNTVSVNLTNGTNGQVIIGGGAAPAWANITSGDGSVTITNGANTLDLSVASGTGTVDTLTGNSGGQVHPVGGNINVVGDNTTGVDVVGTPGTHTLTITTTSGHPFGQSLTGDAGGAVFFDGSGNINTVGAHGLNSLGNPGAHSMTYAINNNITLGDLSVITTGNDALTVTSGNITLSGTGLNAAGNLNMPNTSADERQGEIRFGGARFVSNFGPNASNTFVGTNSGSLANLGVGSGGNSAFGFQALNSLAAAGPNGAGLNTAVGAQCMQNFSASGVGGNTGANTGVGSGALFTLTTGVENTAVGTFALQNVSTSSNNVAVGGAALEGLTTGASNVAIGHTTGTNAGGGTNLKTGSFNVLIGEAAGGAYNGAESNNVVVNHPGIVATSNKYFMAFGNGGNTFFHNFGTENTFVGDGTGNITMTGVNNTGVGAGILSAITTGGNNCALGWGACDGITTGSNNIGIGVNACEAVTTGQANIGIGNGNVSATTGSGNTSVGNNALAGPGNNGSENSVYGHNAASTYTGAESNNVMIHNVGVVGESNIIRIGSTGGTIAANTKTFIAAIRGVTTTNNDAVAVLIDSAGQLGTVSSSARYKDNINDLGDSSEFIYDLRPVVFNYKKHSPEDKSVGLIAEEVASINPRLVVYDEDSRPETVKYQDLPVLLLNELQKLRAYVEQLEERIAELEGCECE
jgi:hypothetical protein